MTEWGNVPNTNDVLLQRIIYLERETKKNIKDIESLEREVSVINRFTDQMDSSHKYMKESMAEMKSMINSFISIVQKQNEKIDQNVVLQNEKIDEFVSSDKRATSKKDFAVSVANAIGTIILTIVTLWLSGII